MSVIGSNVLAGASGNQAAGDTGRSVRFNDGDGAFLSRTPSSAGNRRTFTWAAWVKRSALSSSSEFALFGMEDDVILAFAQDKLKANVVAGANALTTSAVFRDLAWYHLVFAIDTTNATADNRVRIYVNGSEITDFSNRSNPSQNADTNFNQASVHYIGRQRNSDPRYFDGFLTDIYFIDGSQLGPTSFGAFDSNGVWQKADYSGSYGTNGFHLLDFENESTVGHDSSGNGNDFTANNISTTAGAGNDVLFDFPANGSADDSGAGAEINGCYCNFNPLDSNQTHSNGNLFVTCAGGTSPRAGTGTIAVSSGKYYYEITVTESDAAKGIIGFVEAAYDGNGSTIPNANGNSVFYFGENGNKFIDGSATSYGASYGNNDVIGVALNLDDDEITFYKNGTSQGTITTKTFTGAYKPAVGRGASSGSTSYTLNAGARAFSYAAPSGFKTLNTASLPTPTVPNGRDYFDVATWTGNGSTQSITSLSFQPDFLWYKSRGDSYHHGLQDSVRGVGKSLSTSRNDIAEQTETTGLDDFTSNGFDLDGQGFYFINTNNDPMVGWAWDAGNLVASSSFHQSQTWSSATLSDGTDLANLFDGDLSTSAKQSTNGTAASITNFGPISVSSTVSFYSPDGDARYTLNGGTEQSFTGAGWHDISFTGTLTSFTFQGPGNARIFIFGMKVDNKQLVDPGHIPADSISSGVPSIASYVRANQSAGFSIVTYTGNGTSGASVGHGLNTKPDLLIVKNRDRAVNWVVYHSAVGATKYLPLNLTTAATSWTGFLNDTEPTSSVITLGNGSGPNHNGENIIIYAMHAVEGYSKFGSYTGNGASGYPNADGPFIHLGFRPAFILWKCTSQAENWTIYDTARGPSNYIDNKLNPNSSAAESTNANHEIDFLSNGFKVRNNNGEFNQNNGTYVYVAFAENPFQANGGLAR